MAHAFARPLKNEVELALVHVQDEHQLPQRISITFDAQQRHVLSGIWQQQLLYALIEAALCQLDPTAYKRFLCTKQRHNNSNNGRLAQ